MESDELYIWKEKFETGDTSPLVEVMQLYGTYCVSYLPKLYESCSKADAEDIFMDSLIQFRKNIIDNKLTELTNLKGYLFSICKNKYLKKYRSKSKEYTNIDDLYFYFYEHREFDISYDPLVDREEKEADLKNRNTQLEKISSALMKLNENCQKILKQFYVENRSMEQIADLMNFKSKDVAKATKYRCYRNWLKKVNDLNIQVIK